MEGKIGGKDGRMDGWMEQKIGVQKERKEERIKGGNKERKEVRIDMGKKVKEEGKDRKERREREQEKVKTGQ